MTKRNDNFLKKRQLPEVKSLLLQEDTFASESRQYSGRRIFKTMLERLKLQSAVRKNSLSLPLNIMCRLY